MAEPKNDTKQSKPLLDENGKFAKGNTPPAGFNVNPQNRHNGAWKKESTPRYKLEKMMQLSESELLEVAKDKQAPLFERRLAIAINKSDWKTIDSMINQVYGKPAEKVDVTSQGEKLEAPVVRIIDERPKSE